MNVVANVVLSESQAKWMYSSHMFNKTKIIHNFVSYNGGLRKNNNSLNVYYIGAIYPSKNLDCLTSIWPKVLRIVPNAKLYVIGSSRVYSSNAEVGSLGISSPDYERLILGPIRRPDILKSVSFLGKLSNNEIYHELENCKVGVVNPVGTGETFCISALNFGAMGIPVVAGNFGGLKTTLPENCGFKVKTRRELCKKIVQVLLDSDLNNRFGNKYHEIVCDKFTLTEFEEKWINLIDCIFDNSEISNTKLYSKLNCLFSSLADRIYMFLRKIDLFFLRNKWRRK